MTIPVLTFFNNKGGVGKTTLAYHVTWMLGEMGHRVLAADLDPQANLTSAFLDEDQLVNIWEEVEDQPNTIFRCIHPLLEVGDIRTANRILVTREVSLIPGDLALSGFEDELSNQWPASMGDSNLVRPFKVLTAFWHVIQDAASAHDADLIIIDVGPNLGAINRSALIASDFVLIPLGADLFSLQGLRNLGPTLRSWRSLWKRRLDNWESPTIGLPQGDMQPMGYIAQQHGVRLSRPVKAYNRWLNRIPLEYRRNVLGENVNEAPVIDQDPVCLAMLKNYQSLIPMAMEARKPIFMLRSADGAIGAHSYAVQDAYQDYSKLTMKILAGIGLGPGRFNAKVS
ncbi:MAG: AAA family ATPase [Rhodospirillum sp.]|nr:AAA family ATPase [Rhodospirillum sp.]MCF8488306.1 AAA family ATPase [Rhodospirillum sp.]MCF8503140.1 AAA family ATPase [Rhodospirillum sp.]